MINYGLLGLLMGLSSCGIYRQNVVNAPLLQQKGHTQISGHNSFSGLEVQAAYALTKKLAVLANYGDMGTKIENSNNNYFNKHSFKEFGAGLYQKRETGRIREAFLMVGKGTSERTRIRPDSTGKSLSGKASYNRFALQADFGNTKKKLEHALSPRLLGVHYSNIVDNTRSDYKDLSNFHIYAEGAVTLRYNLLNFLQITGQFCATLPLIRSGGGYNYYYDFSPFNLGIGLLFNINLSKPVN
ncbi:hypothetical protein EXU57_08955 [Segetibacter sp. 3557_3]|uniref:hypothetical protein n=1 Tax=Segetibacter sp. 3557_3 TaxID=2547429 RepID=UPI001058739E|nr:hypothetical protein [Segetibacter sp. 3557_3]TDH26923.1 hypothetical protein EXU57_08955 [Segetibacter sp. 3557_3]